MSIAFLDFSLWVFIKEKKKKRKTVRDDTEQKNWDSRKKEIENKYKEEIVALQEDCDELEQLKFDKKSESSYIEKLKKRIEANIERLKKEKEEEAQIKQQEEIARTSLLKKYKKQLCDCVDSNIGIPNGTLFLDLTASIHKYLKKSQDEMTGELERYYNDNITDYQRQIDILINKSDSSNYNNETEQIKMYNLIGQEITSFINKIKNINNEL